MEETSTMVENSPKIITDIIAKDLTVDCILSDVDGTLLMHGHGLSEENLIAITEALGKGYLFFPCTGRSRSSMINIIGDGFVKLFGSKQNIPGVYLQGLTVYGQHGTLIHQKTLEQDIIEKIIEFCDRNKIPVLAYSGDDMYCKVRCKYTDVVMDSDPAPIEVPEGLNTLKSLGINIQKMVLLEEDDKLNHIRGKLESEYGSIVTVTKAVPGFLEILPFGSSKGEGVQILLDHFQVSPDNVIAFGDGENDIEMLSLVKYGVAMANASPLLKSRAAFITGHVKENGVGNVIKHLKYRCVS